MKFKLAPAFTERFPDAFEYIVVATNVNNEIPGKWILDRSSKVSEQLREKGETVLLESKYKDWTVIYDALSKAAKLKTKDFMPSHVALAKRVLSGKDLPNINPLVNFYNLYSLQYGVPIGGENLGELYGDEVLDLTRGGERFLFIGGKEIEVLPPGEVVWKDDHSVTCRMWAWRQCEHTKITKETKDAYFIFDGYNTIKELDLKSVVERFVAELKEKFECDVKIGRLDRMNPEFQVEYKTRSIAGVDIGKDLHKYLLKKNTEGKSTAILKRRPVQLGLIDEKHFLARMSHVIAEALKGTEYAGSGNLKIMNSHFGDLALVDAMELAKKNRKFPKEIAEGIVDVLKNDTAVSSIFSKIDAHPSGFVNLTFSKAAVVSELKRGVSECVDFGSSHAGNNKVMLVESPSINPNAAAHVGHLMNLFIGRSLARLFEKVGFKSKLDNLINDRGIKICMAMWGVEHLAKGKTPDTMGMKSDQFVGTYYVRAKQMYQEDPKVKAQIQQMLREWESGDARTLELWKKVVNWAYEGHKLTFERLHEEQGHLWFESNIYKGGKDVIEKHMKKGVIEKLPDGAVIGRLEKKYGVPDVILLRADGTSLYETQDICLTMLKVKKFKPWKVIWVVGSEQLAHFQKLFALFESIGILSIDSFYHMAYGLVVDKNGVKIGKNAADATADMVLDQMKKAALAVMKKRKVQHEISRIEEIAEAVGQGALRYAFLSKDPFKGTVYDPESALSFTGKSGPYIMYAYTRAKNVLRKGLGKQAEDGKVYDQLDEQKGNFDLNDDERKLALFLISYPETVLSAANSYAPNIISEYLYNVARSFNNLYEKETIAGAQGDDRLLRLLLTRLTANVIKDGLEILGIRTLEKM